MYLNKSCYVVNDFMPKFTLNSVCIAVMFNHLQTAENVDFMSVLNIRSLTFLINFTFESKCTQIISCRIISSPVYSCIIGLFNSAKGL